MCNRLPEFLKLFIPRQPRSITLRKRDRFRKYLVEALEPRNLLATFTVTALTDDVNSADDATIFTLREALNAANASVADDTIQFAPALTASGPANITMTGATFQLNAASGSGITTINGPGADLLSISGNGSNNGRIFFANAGANVVIRGLTIKNGRAFDNVNALSGGAISNDGTMTIEDCIFDNNQAQLDGGAIRNRNVGTLQIFGTTFKGNSAGQDGGAIAILNSASTTIVNSTFSGNSAQRHGGAVLAASTNSLSIIHATIVANTARSTNGASGDGGGISGNGAVELHNSIVAGNKRGTVSPLDSDIVSSVGSSVNIITSNSTGNLIGHAASASGLVHGTNGNILGNNGSGVLPPASILDPTLRNNGGRTLTHALVTKGPAIDKGFFDYTGTGFNIDQRGQLRPFDDFRVSNNGNGRDIGAFELTQLNIDLSNLGFDGTTIFGADTGDESGSSISNAGDINGDGFDDLVVGAPNAAASGNAKSIAGESYVIFGGSSLPATIDLANLGSAGITIFGADTGDFSGSSVSSAGDVNGDGFDDLTIGARLADAAGNAKSSEGESYVIFGGNGFTNSIAVANLGTNTGNTITGAAGPQILNGADGDDTLVGSGGADILLDGRGNDILAVSDLSFKRLVGGNGNDTIRLDGSGLHLNLTTIRDNRIVDIETIDLTGSGNNTLTLTAREVLNLSTHSNTLVVRRNAGDMVNIGTGWTQILNQAIGPTTFNAYSQGVARLLVQTTSVDSTPPNVTAIIAAGSAWSPAFIDSVDGGGTGTGNGLGYALTSGLTLPNSGINRLYVQFSEPVVGFSASRLQLLGVNVANYSTAPGFLNVSYDAANFRGVIQFASAITKDKLRIGISDTVTDVASIALDGDANATAGGVLNFRFNILVGDASNDGSVNGGDLPLFANSFNKSVGAVGFNPRANWNSDDSVNGGDLPLFSGNFNQSLPGAEPGPLTFMPLPPLMPSDEEDLYAPLIDDFFSQFGEEEESLLLEE